MNWEKIYNEETGNDASYTKIDEWNGSRTHDWYYDEYVDWLESKLTAVSQPGVEADGLIDGPECNCSNPQWPLGNCINCGGIPPAA